MEKKSTIQQIEKANRYYADGKYKSAQAIIKKILRKAPRNAEALHTLGLIKYYQGKSSEAIKCLRDALSIDGNRAEWYKNLAIIYGNNNSHIEAARAALKAVELKEDYSDAYCLLGEALFLSCDYSNSITAYARAIKYDPKKVDYYLGIAKSLNMSGQADQAINALLEAMQIDKNNPFIYGDLGAYYFHIGLVEESIICLKRLVELTPESAANLSSLISTLVYRYDFNDELMADFLLYNAKHCLPVAKKIKRHINEPNPNKKIKIGYVSADYYNHSVAFYITPVLENHDKSRFEIYCYYNNTVVDNNTRKIRMHANHWVECFALSDEDLAEKIRQDGIDILVDLSGHTLGNRLTVFAQKPAPIQISWIGFPSTTGLTQMDYIILREALVTKNAEKYFTEKLILTEKTAPFMPPKKSPEINELPALKNKYITFASFNMPFKITKEIIKLWSEILNRVSKAQLLLFIGKTNSEKVKGIFLDEFESNGVSRERIKFHSHVSQNDYLKTHLEIDIMLDTYPYNGATTTRLSLWMGVPVVTLKGLSPQTRIGAALLSEVSCSKYIANKPEEYVDIACGIASDYIGLNNVRKNLRGKLMSQDNLSSKDITENFEGILINKWSEWCGRVNKT